MTNIEILKNWVAALRSDKFQQGGGCLRKGDNYCCLGVLCEICGLEKIKDHDRYYYKYDNDATGTQLPDPFAEKLKIDSYPFIMNEFQEKVNLAHLNDCGTSFKVIADLIEAQIIPTVVEKIYD